MALNSGVESQNANASCETTVKKSTISKPSTKSKISNDVEVSRTVRNAAIKLRLRSKTAEGTDLREHRKSQRPTSASFVLDNGLKNDEKTTSASFIINKGLKIIEKSESCLSKDRTETVENEYPEQIDTTFTNRQKSSLSLKSQAKASQKSSQSLKNQQRSSQSLKSQQKSSQSLKSRQNETPVPKRILFYDNPSDTYSKLYKGLGPLAHAKTVRREFLNVRPSEIPKLKKLREVQWKNHMNRDLTPSKLPLKAEQFQIDAEQRTSAAKGKREAKDEKIKNALKENFSSLVPLYEHELKKITDTWVNTIYCSLTMRANLARLLYKILPTINKAQFHTEDETLLNYIARAKSYTTVEAENLMQFIKLLMVNRNKAKDDYMVMMTNKQIAESYNNNWKALSKRIVELGEENKQLQMEIPALEKKKENYEVTANERIKKIESNLSKKDEEIKKLNNQLSMLKHRENSYKSNVSLKLEDYKDIKEEVVSLKCVEKEFEELKAKYVCQNDIFEKKIKELEVLLEEKKKTLKKEKELKKQMQSFLLQLHTHEKHMCRRMGKEQVDFVMGRSAQSKSKRRDQLWVSAVKLVLKGFLVQMKKLERDRNKMLLELNSNDLANYNSLATAIIQKDNFIKSIKHQMNAFQAASKCQSMKTSQSSIM